MWFKRVTLKNFGPFTDFTADLTRGSIGLVGRNGAGKSTLLDAMYSCVSNDFGRFNGPKAGRIRNTAEAGAQSFIEIEIEHDADTLRIRRNISGKGKTELSLNGGPAITDAAKAQMEIDNILGVDRRMLDLYVFKTQDKIYDFLATTPAERAKAYATLCGTEHCEDLWNLVGRVADKDRLAIDQTVDNSDELNRKKAELKDQVHDLIGRAAEEAAKCLNAKSAASAQDIVRKARRHGDLGRELPNQRAVVQQALQAMTDSQRQADTLAGVADEAAELVETLRPESEAAKAAMATLDLWQRQEERRRALLIEGSALTKEKLQKAKTAPVRPCAEDVDIDAERTSLADMRAQLKAAQDLLNKFAENGVAYCPTCGTAVEAFEDRLTDARAVIHTLSPKIAEVAALLVAYDNYVAADRVHEKWRAGFDARVTANAKALAALPKPTPAANKDREALDKDIANYVRAVTEAMLATTRFRAAETAKARAEATHAAVTDRLAALEAELSSTRQEEVLIARAEARLAEHTVAANNAARLEGEAAGVKTALAAVKSDLTALQARLRRGRKLKKTVAIMDAARAVLHRDRLPRRVAASNLVRMEADINAGLAEFGDPFWVETDETLSFVAHKPGEPAQPADWLSTGQKVVLALAFWPAVASLWSADLGALVLDEPTANLDAANRQCLAQALGRLSAQVRGRRQLIIVTHDPDLRGAFDQVIDLG